MVPYICIVKIRLTALFLFFATQLFAGTITTTVSFLSNFGNVYPFFSSTSLRYTVVGTSLSSGLVITADNGFEVSTQFGYGYSNSLTLTPVSGNIDSTIIFVRFSPSVAGSFSGNITNSSTGSTSINVAVSGTCIAPAIPAGYYSTVNTQTGAALKTVLYNKIASHTQVSYTPGVWNAFYTTDIQQSGKVWDIYSTTLHQKPPYEFTLGSPHQDNGTGGSVEGDKYNREHSFPQSWFGSTGAMQSDLNHVFATDKKVNNERNNYPFGTVNAPTFTSLIGGKLGPNTYPGYSGVVFEPVNEYKGDLARGYFYMATCYENLIGTWSTNGNAGEVLAGNSFPAFDSWHINLLLEWHNMDPVSDKEIKRNNAIYALQNNRNPFIDSPQFAQRIWGGNIPAKPTLAASNFSVTNLSNTSVTLTWKSGNGNRRMVIVKAGSAVNGFPADSTFYTANANLSLASQIGSGNYIVYNGTGSSITLTNLTQGTTYHYAVIEYNGWYSTSNYQTSGILTSSATTLPVELLSFSATLMNNDQVLLKWATASELNNDYFTIERSFDNQSWESIGNTKGAGNSHKTSHYQYADNLNQSTDNTINQSTLYYRLKQTDFDGTSSYSKTVSVNLQQNELTQISVGPNPFNDNLRISFQTPVYGEISYSVQNLMGETYVDKRINLQNGAEQYIDLGGLSNIPVGIYVLQLHYAGQNHQYKIIKQ